MNVKRGISNFVSDGLFLISAIRLFWKIYFQQPKKPIAGVCLEGDTSLRLSETLALYRKGIINYIIVSGGVNDPQTDNLPASVMKDILIRNGVPANIIEQDNESEYTDDHPEYISKIIKKHELKDLLIITSGYHLLRAYLRFLYTFSLETDDCQLYGYPAGSLFTWFQKSPTEKKYRLSIFLHDELQKIKTYRNLASVDFALKYVLHLKAQNLASTANKTRS